MKVTFFAILAAVWSCLPIAAQASTTDCGAVRNLKAGSSRSAVFWARGECAGEIGATSKQVYYYRQSLHQGTITIEGLYAQRLIPRLFAFTAALSRNHQSAEARHWWVLIDAYYGRMKSRVYPSPGGRLFDEGRYPQAFHAFYRSLYVVHNEPDFTGYLGESGQGNAALEEGLHLAASGRYAAAIAVWRRANYLDVALSKTKYPEATFFIGCADYALRERLQAGDAWIASLGIAGPPVAIDGYIDNRQLDAVHFLAGSIRKAP